MSLDTIMQKIRALGGLAATAAHRAAPLVEERSTATAAAGTTPTGQAWAPKKDGTPALVNAAAAVSVVALDTVVQIKLIDSSTGSAQVQSIQQAKRKIIPSLGDAIPGPIVAELRKGAEQAFQELAR